MRCFEVFQSCFSQREILVSRAGSRERERERERVREKQRESKRV